jgi:hypothetical protein
MLESFHGMPVLDGVSDITYTDAHVNTHVNAYANANTDLDAGNTGRLFYLHR